MRGGQHAMRWANDVEVRSWSQGQSFEQTWRRRWWSWSPFTLRTVPYIDAFCMHERGRKATQVAVRRRPAMYGAVSRHTSLQHSADAKIICYLPLFITSPAQRNDGRQRNVWWRSVCDCCRRNRLQRRHFSLVTNIVAITWMCTGCESSCKFLETQVISSSLDGWTVAWRPARWGGWSSALITLSSAVLSLSLSLTTPTFPLSPCCL